MEVSRRESSNPNQVSHGKGGRRDILVVSLAGNGSGFVWTGDTAATSSPSVRRVAASSRRRWPSWEERGDKPEKKDRHLPEVVSSS